MRHPKQARDRCVKPLAVTRTLASGAHLGAACVPMVMMGAWMGVNGSSWSSRWPSLASAADWYAGRRSLGDTFRSTSRWVMLLAAGSSCHKEREREKRERERKKKLAKKRRQRERALSTYSG